MLRISQRQETPVTAAAGEAWGYRYAYARAAESRAAGDPGQDYLVVQPGERSFVFALCDGVSQSFFGDLAARLLGDALVAWLANDLGATMDEAAQIQGALSAYLGELTGPASVQVQGHPLPPDLPPMLREVLEEKRALGSESTFVCGRIDLPGPGRAPGRVVLAWMGDSRLRIWAGKREITADLGGAFDTMHRWSSRRGPIGGPVNVYVAPLDGSARSASRLMAYSDGLAALDEVHRSPSNQVLQHLIQQAGESATSDDISFLELYLKGAQPAGERSEEPPLGIPAGRVPSVAAPEAQQAARPEPAPRPSPQPELQKSWALPAVLLALVFVVGLLAVLVLHPQSPLHPVLFGRPDTPTPAATAAATFTATLFPTQTPTETATATATGTAAPTETATLTATHTATLTATHTATPSATPAPSPTATESPTSTLTPTFGPDPSDSPLPTPTSTSSSPLPTPTPTPTTAVQATPAPQLVVWPSEGEAGTEISVSGVGLRPNAQVEVYWDQPELLLGQTTTNEQGSLDPLTSTVPADAESGAHQVRAVLDGTESISATFIVTE